MVEIKKEEFCVIFALPGKDDKYLVACGIKLICTCDVYDQLEVCNITGGYRAQYSFSYLCQ